MKRSKGIVTSALPRLLPTLIMDTATGEVLTWDAYLSGSLSPLLEWVYEETNRLYLDDVQKAHMVSSQLTGSANSFARQNGYKANHLKLAREVKAKSRLAEIVYHKLMSETASYENNPDPRKKVHSFSTTINLGAVDKQMCFIEREGNEIILTWACWAREFEMRFTLPKYVLNRKIAKISLPLVDTRGFVFTYQENPDPIRGGKVAGLDLGRIEPFTMVVLSPQAKVLASYKATKQLRATNAKRERILVQLNQTKKKADAREKLGLDSTHLHKMISALREKSTRMASSLSAQSGAQVGKVMMRHAVSLLRLEDLSWVRGPIYGSKWTHSQAGLMISHATRRQGAKIQKVNPSGTSQHCHSCKSKIVHNSKKRTIWCENCKTHLDRDYNAALNIAKNQSFPIMKNRHDGSTCSGIPQSTGQTFQSLQVQMFESDL